MVFNNAAPRLMKTEMIENRMVLPELKDLPEEDENEAYDRARQESVDDLNNTLKDIGSVYSLDLCSKIRRKDMNLTDDDMRVLIEDIDPDWRDHFLYIEHAWKFYKDTPEVRDAEREARKI